MGQTLHITNGDSAVSLMQAAGIDGDILSWRDVLHDGPVPMGLNLEALSRVRADFIADLGWADRDNVHSGFAERDAVMRRWRDYQRITLWFEHDLYDQLQILQILDFFASETGAKERLSMICTDKYLGYCSPKEIAELRRFETSVNDDQLNLACTAWAAFREPDPLAWYSLLNQDTQLLPFLEGAVTRFIAELPDRQTGLGRTELRALNLLADGSMTAGKMFAANQKAEERIYLGDLSYWRLLGEMMQADPPLLRAMDGIIPTGADSARGEIELTAAGRALLDGQASASMPHWSMRWHGGCCQLRSEHWCQTDGAAPERIQSRRLQSQGPIDLRRASTEDAPAIRACAHAAYSQYVHAIGKPPGPMLEDYAAVVLSDEVHVAVGPGNDVTGFVVLKSQDNGLLLDNVAVDPDAQGCGIGSRLMELAETRGLELGYREISLYTHEAMANNLALYTHLGYAETHRAREAGYDRVYMAKSLIPRA